MHLKMLSAEVVCCKTLPNNTDELTIEADSLDPEHLVHTVCHRGYLNISAGSAVAECLTRDREAAGSSLTGVTVLWSLSKTHLS